MAEGRIRVGIIGANAHTGWSMQSHLPAILALPEYELTAVCTSRRETAEESASHYGARLAFHDYREMVTHPDIDLVTVCLPVLFHHSMVIAALEAGKHVFCEWPLAANVAEAEEMAAVARSRQVRNMVCLQSRCSPALLRLKELLEGGYVGEVLSCSLSMFLPGILQRGKARAWAALRENGMHDLSINTGHSVDALGFCVAEFQELSARVTTQVPVWETSEPGNTVQVTSPDNVMINGVLTNGAVASVHVSRIPWHGTGWRLEVYGRAGTLVATAPDRVQFGLIRLWGGRSQDAGMEELPIPDRLTWVPEGVPAHVPFNVAQMYRRLRQAIRENDNPSPDFDLAVERHRLLEVIQRSSDQGMKQQVT